MAQRMKRPRHMTIRLTEEECLLVSDVQRLVKLKGYERLRNLCGFTEDDLADYERLTKSKTISLGMKLLLRRLEHG